MEYSQGRTARKLNSLDEILSIVKDDKKFEGKIIELREKEAKAREALNAAEQRKREAQEANAELNRQQEELSKERRAFEHAQELAGQAIQERHTELTAWEQRLSQTQDAQYKERGALDSRAKDLDVSSGAVEKRREALASREASLEKREAALKEASDRLRYREEELRNALNA